MNLQSDYRYRGRSLSDGQPTLTLNLAYDHSSGPYAGGSAIAGPTRHEGVHFLGYIAYAGYATHPRGYRPGLDLGVARHQVNDFRVGRRSTTYDEVYGGALTRHFSFRAYYAPNYYKTGLETLYSDLGASFRPARNLRLFGHAGLLTAIGGRRGRIVPDRYDFSAGAVASRGPLELSLTLSTVTPAVRVGGREERPDNVVVGVAFFF